MTHETQTQAASNGQSPWDAQTSGEQADEQRPEILVGAAFVGGLVLAQILKRLGGGGD